MTGRACHAIELNPVYVDVAVRRWQAFTGKTAVLEANGCSFAEIADAARRCLRDGAAWRSAAASLSRSRPRSRRAIRARDRSPPWCRRRQPGDMLCPQAVQRNERALAYWTMYLANAAPGHLSPIDAPLLARLCMALAYADEANDKIEELGLLVKAPNTGLPIQSPYLPVLNRQTELARKLAAELALPPAQRNRVGPYGPGPGRPVALGRLGGAEMTDTQPAYPDRRGQRVTYAATCSRARIAACRLVQPHLRAVPRRSRRGRGRATDPGSSVRIWPSAR